jgi:hypothetical protein
MDDLEDSQFWFLLEPWLLLTVATRALTLTSVAKYMFPKQSLQGEFIYASIVRIFV